MQRKYQFRMELMRHSLLALLLVTTVTVPAFAQSSGGDINRRVDMLERELRAVQRKVFPNGAGALPLTPEIGPTDTTVTPSGVPATNALADVNARLDALEGQLRTLTGQAEEDAHRLAVMEKVLADFRTATEGRLTAVEKPALDQDLVSSPTPPAKGTTTATGSTGTASNPAGDPAEAAYLEGYKLWSTGKFAEAQTVLEAMVKKYPKHPRSSFAQNLLGRAYLDGGKPAAAAKIFLANYENNRNGERAPDSLFYLGQALVRLNQPANACKVFDELESVYGVKLRAAIKDELPKARATAKCH